MGNCCGAAIYEPTMIRCVATISNCDWTNISDGKDGTDKEAWSSVYQSEM